MDAPKNLSKKEIRLHNYQTKEISLKIWQFNLHKYKNVIKIIFEEIFNFEFKKLV